MSQRMIDIPLHDLNSSQALEQILQMFRESKSEPIVILTMPGESRNTIQTIRTNLSHQRREAERRGQAFQQFGFSIVSEPTNFSIDGRRLEAIGIAYHATLRQQMINQASNMFDFDVENLYVRQA